MTLYDLIELSNAGHLRRNLGDNWEYELTKNGFNMTYKDDFGGIIVKIFEGTEEEDYNKPIHVYRIFNGSEETIFNGFEQRARTTLLENIHWGVSQRMKYIFGF
ncbi:hypothetical protein BACERE00183_04667 [Bacillus cereus]|nr:hypothetical protein BACERE00183_04667 [Bacillus cereus]